MLCVAGGVRDDMINMMEVGSFDNSNIHSHIENSCSAFLGERMNGLFAYFMKYMWKPSGEEKRHLWSILDMDLKFFPNLI